MKVIGLTGSFGTGKSFVASIFKAEGAKVLDADRIAHAAIAKGGRAYRRIVRAFGRDVLDASGAIDRRRLAKKDFGNSGAVRRLNRIVHPEVIAFIKKKIRAAGKDETIIIDAPLLVEAGLTGLVDKLVVVKCGRKHQIDRSAKKFGIQKEDVLRRIESQASLAAKIKLADFVVDNDGPRSRTKAQVNKIRRQIIWK